jgi:hypothetical protein
VLNKFSAIDYEMQAFFSRFHILANHQPLVISNGVATMDYSNVPPFGVKNNRPMTKASSGRNRLANGTYPLLERHRFISRGFAS